MQDVPASTNSRHTPPTVVCQGVRKSFGEQQVLRGIDLTIRRGELVAIVGGSGCGKTVLLQCIIGHLKIDGGSIKVADYDGPDAPLREIADLDEDQLDRIRTHWAVVFQRNALFSGSVLENMLLLPDQTRGQTEAQVLPRARAALSAVGLDPDLVLPRQRDNLSGGMAKRVSIARALVLDPAIIFYDEPTAGLDPEHTTIVHDLIARTHASPTDAGIQRTTLVITHDVSLLRRLEPRVVMLEKGAVCFDGAFQSFLESDLPSVRPYLEMMPTLHLRCLPAK